MSFLLDPYRFGGGGAPAIPFSAVVLLSGFEGSDGSQSFTDESSYGHTMSAQSQAQIDTAQFKFGSSSALFDGSSDRIAVTDSNDWHFGSGAFTLECWVRFSGDLSSKTAMFITQTKENIAQRGFRFGYIDGSGLVLQVSSNGLSYGGSVVEAWSPSINTWYHVAADRDDSGVMRIYVDGVMLGKTTYANSLWNSNWTLDIGGSGSSSAWTMLGWIDEARVTKGYAQYGSDSGYTVPTEAFPRS